MGIDEGGREKDGLENIRFDVPLDDALFNLTPPAGYAVRDERGPTLAQLRSPATTQEAARFTLKPGQGIGEVPFRATREAIVAAFGEPESSVKDEPRPGWTKLEYPSRGMTLMLGPEGGLRSVNAYNAVRGAKVAHNFPGKTDRGIGINSTGEQLQAAYGPPETASPTRTAENRFVRYPRLGMTAALGTGTITSITITPAGGMGIELPITDDARRRAEAMVLKPGVGIDDLKLGATRAEAIAALGPPADPNAGDLQYPVIGLSLNFDKDGRLRDIWGATPRELENDGNPFFGHTDKGIRLGATRADVEAAYGKADEVEEALAKVQENVAPSEVIVYLNYNTLGLMVEFKGGRVTALCVQRPKPATAQPTTR
jgi:hypothetical protein